MLFSTSHFNSNDRFNIYSKKLPSLLAEGGVGGCRTCLPHVGVGQQEGIVWFGVRADAGDANFQMSYSVIF